VKKDSPGGAVGDLLVWLQPGLGRPGLQGRPCTGKTVAGPDAVPGFAPDIACSGWRCRPTLRKGGEGWGTHKGKNPAVRSLRGETSGPGGSRHARIAGRPELQQSKNSQTGAAKPPETPSMVSEPPSALGTWRDTMLWYVLGLWPFAFTPLCCVRSSRRPAGPFSGPGSTWSPA